MHHSWNCAAFVALLAAPAAAQSFNLRYTTFAPVPAPTFGAATGQAGVWNALTTPIVNTVENALVDLSGAPTGAVARLSGCDAYICAWTGYGADIQSLFAGTVNGDCYGDPSFTLLEGLQPGHYVLTAYGPPCYEQLKTIQVRLSDGSYDKSAQVGGTYSGSFSSMTLASFEFTLPAGVTVRIGAGYFAYLSALQVTAVELPAVYCTSKLNSEGCAASIAVSGTTASLSAATPFVVSASQAVTDTPGLLFYGTAADIKPFLGGWHCVKPPTPRTTGQFSGNQGAPCGGIFAFDFNAWLQAGPVPEVFPGTQIHAQYWYRDPADPMGFGSATSNAVRFYVTP